MNIGIIGIGGIGGYVGFALAQSYTGKSEHCITFIQRGDHFKQIKACGLTYITRKESTVRPDFVYETTKEAGLFDIVFIAVKSRDLEATALSLQGNIQSHSVIIPLLNGVTNAKRLQKLLPNTCVLNGCIYVSSAIEKPGTIRQTGGAGNLIFGPEIGDASAYQYIEKLLNEAGIKAILSTNITKAVWEKYMLISSWASLSSRYALPIGAILADDDKKNELMRLLNEAASIAKAYGIELDESIARKCMERYKQLPYENKTSMQLDFESGKQPEIDIMTKYIVDSADELGVEVPAYREVLQALNKL